MLSYPHAGSQPQTPHLPAELLHSPVRAAFSRDFGDLALIYEDDINLSLIERTLSDEISQFVHTLLQEKILVDIRCPIPPQGFDFTQLAPRASHIKGYQAWCQDVAQLVEAFCDLMDTPQAGLRLSSLNKPMCPRFHVDRVPARLVCTYGGPGTEWLLDNVLDRDLLGLQDIPCHPHYNTRIQTMPTGAIGLMKGQRWNGDYPQGLVHRSPCIDAAHSRRLLLTLDMV